MIGKLAHHVGARLGLDAAAHLEPPHLELHDADRRRVLGQRLEHGVETEQGRRGGRLSDAQTHGAQHGMQRPS